MKRHRTNRIRKRFRPGVEALEGRCLLSGVSPLPSTGSAAALVDVLTYHNADSGTGANRNETMLMPQDVNTSSFGKLFHDTVDGFVYAQLREVRKLRMGDGQLHKVHQPLRREVIDWPRIKPEGTEYPRHRLNPGREKCSRIGSLARFPGQGTGRAGTHRRTEVSGERPCLPSPRSA